MRVSNEDPGVEGRIVTKCTIPDSYEVEVGQRIFRRNSSHLTSLEKCRATESQRSQEPHNESQGWGVWQNGSESEESDSESEGSESESGEESGAAEERVEEEPRRSQRLRSRRHLAPDYVWY